MAKKTKKVEKETVKEELKAITVPVVEGSYSVKFTGSDLIETELSLAQAKAKVKQLETQDKILKGKNWSKGFYEIV